MKKPSSGERIRVGDRQATASKLKPAWLRQMPRWKGDETLFPLAFKNSNESSKARLSSADIVRGLSFDDRCAIVILVVSDSIAEAAVWALIPPMKTLGLASLPPSV